MDFTFEIDGYRIRMLDTRDAGQYFSLIDRNRARLEDFFAGTCSKNRTPDDTMHFIQDASAKAKNKTYFPFVIEDPANGLIGYTDIKSIDWSIPKAEIGFFIDAKYEGRGIITQSTSKMVSFCFDELQMKKIYLRTHELNSGSRRIAEKNGFIVEGIIRSDYKTTGGDIVDLVYYGLLPSDLKRFVSGSEF